MQDPARIDARECRAEIRNAATWCEDRRAVIGVDGDDVIRTDARDRSRESIPKGQVDYVEGNARRERFEIFCEECRLVGRPRERNGDVFDARFIDQL